MKKIINGKTYNTDTAKEVGTSTFPDGNGGRTLYRKRTGEYFIATWHHPYHTYFAIKTVTEDEIDGYIWDKLIRM